MDEKRREETQKEFILTPEERYDGVGAIRRQCDMSRYRNGVALGVVCRCHQTGEVHKTCMIQTLTGGKIKPFRCNGNPCTNDCSDFNNETNGLFVCTGIAGHKIFIKNVVINMVHPSGHVTHFGTTYRKTHRNIEKHIIPMMCALGERKIRSLLESESMTPPKLCDQFINGLIR